MDTERESVHGEVSQPVGRDGWWPASPWREYCEAPEEPLTAPPSESEQAKDWASDRDLAASSPSDTVHVTRARRVMRFLAANRQDARRAGEDLAIGILLSPRHRKLHRAARLVLGNGSAAYTHVVALATCLLAGTWKTTPRR
jgi:hypothetical protein